MDDVISDLVRDWKLDSTIASDGCTIQTKYVSNPATGQWRTPVVEKWERAKNLGRGTFGVVRLEHCTSGPSAGEVRAVKEIQTAFGSSKVEPVVLFRELLAIIKFSHKRYQDCFVQSFGWYDAQDSIFITMEYLPLGDLELYIRNPLPEAETREISRQILQGLVFMHQSHFAHRDMKPSNILVQHEGPNWWIKISDFGASKQIESTALRTQIGTEPYLAPEVRGLYAPSDLDLEPGQVQTFSLAVDTWSVGAITFRIATGRSPFPQSRDLYRFVVVGTSFPGDDSLSTECTNFITSAMSPSPRQRPTAAQALASSWISAIGPEASIPNLAAETNSRASRLNSESYEEASGRWSTLSNALAIPDGSEASGSAIRHSSPPAKIEPTEPTIKPTDAAKESLNDGPLLPTSRFTRVQQLDRIFDEPRKLAFSPDGKMLAVILGTYATVGIWTLSRSRNGAHFEKSQTLAPLSASVSQLVFTPNSRRLVTKSCDGLLVTWEIDPQGQFQRIPNSDCNNVGSPYNSFTRTTLSQNGLRFVAIWRKKSSREYERTIWKVNSEGRFQHEWTKPMWGLPKPAQKPRIACSPDGRWFAASYSAFKRSRFGHTTRLWDMSNPGKEDQSFFNCTDSLTKAIIPGFSPDSQWLVVGGGPRTVLLGKDDKGNWEKRYGLESKSPILSVAFSSDSQRLAAGREDGQVAIWQFDKNQVFTREKKVKGHTSPVVHIAFSSTNLLASASAEDKKVVIWEKPEW